MGNWAAGMGLIGLACEETVLTVEVLGWLGSLGNCPRLGGYRIGGFVYLLLTFVRSLDASEMKLVIGDGL